MFNFATISSHPGVRDSLALQFINKNSAASVEAVQRERMKNGHANVQAFKSDTPLSPEMWREELVRRGVDMSSIPTAGGRGRSYSDGELQMAASAPARGPRLVAVNTQPLRARTPFEYLSEDIEQATAVIEAAKKEIVAYEEYVAKLRESIPSLELQRQTLVDRLNTLTEADGKPAAEVEDIATATTEEEPATSESFGPPEAPISSQELEALEAAWRLTDEGQRKRVGRHYETEEKWHARFVTSAQQAA